MVTDKRIPKQYHGDNNALINALNQTTPLKPLAPEWDMVELTRRYVQDNGIACSHVKGHQDEIQEQLSDIAKLNIQADKLAAKGRESTTLLPTLPGHRVTLYIHGFPVTTKYDHEMRRAYHSHDIREYYQRRFRWDNTTIQTID